MAQSVVPKKEEKAQKIFTEYGLNISEEEFKCKFIEIYPKDWKRIVDKYLKEEEESKGKKHPMPKPDIYISNLYKVQKKKLK